MNGVYDFACSTCGHLALRHPSVSDWSVKRDKRRYPCKQCRCVMTVDTSVVPLTRVEYQAIA